MSAYWRLVGDGELGEPSNHNGSRTTLPQSPIPDGNREGNAKLRALQHFVAGDSFTQYEDNVDRNGRCRAPGPLIFLPLELPGWGYFVTKEDFKLMAGLHRFVCKCGLANPPFLEMRQSAFCDSSDGRYADSAAYSWLAVHVKRQEVYGPEGFEAPEWDPFPDGRGVILRVDSERESNEQRQMREARWSAGRRTGRQLSQESIQPGAWLPGCQVPTGPAFKERSTWTLEHEGKWKETVEKEKEERQQRRAAFEAEAERQQQLGVRRLVVESCNVPVVGRRSQGSSMSSEGATGPGSGTSGSSSRAVGMSSQTSAFTLGMDLAQSAGCERLTGSSGEPSRGEKWWTAPPKERKPLQIVDPAAKAATVAVPDNATAGNQEEQPPATPEP